ncbi:Abi-alpha family protein [Panacagrimonas sp.]|uniref:Abi-alpha family protein n=1 Tax=Panacagrimonas sp. TaxID=2480088 RepID=UPI003B5224A6
MSQRENREDDGADQAAPQSQEGGSLIGTLANGAWKLAAEGPRLALDLAQKGLSEAERVALSTLRRRMDAVAEEELPETSATREPFSRATSAAAGGEGPVAPTAAAEVMAALLEQAQEQSRDDAQRYLALRIVRQLVPDEARILAALSDGHESALLHLAAGPRIGRATQRWLENLSPVGREAGIQLLDQVPQYIEHLRGLDLLESGEEDPAMQVKYQLLEADTRVRALCEEIEKLGMRPRFVRRTIRLSEAGKAFWAACATETPQGW